MQFLCNVLILLTVTLWNCVFRRISKPNVDSVGTNPVSGINACYWERKGLPWWLKESDCNAGGPGFDLWVRKIPWRREWQPTPVFLPGKAHAWRSLAGYSPWSCKESDTTERLIHWEKKEEMKRAQLWPFLTSSASSPSLCLPTPSPPLGPLSTSLLLPLLPPLSSVLSFLVLSSKSTKLPFFPLREPTKHHILFNWSSRFSQYC